MGSVDRQNRLLAAEDWKKIYQSFRNADFKSYDFDNLRRTMIAYLRENFPEDFNDYIESSEYLALIDLIAFLGQNLAFRFDLNARDNFLELAERRESVLRLARLLSYDVKRNLPANGLLKFNAVSTTEDVVDSNGRNLSSQTVVWNDPSNSNWYEQFLRVINASMTEATQFGRPQDRAVISGIATDQYRINATNTQVPVYGFTKNVDGRNMNFEVVSTVFKDSESIYEEPPFPGNNLAFVYRDDGGGAPSSNTGFFLHFRQGNLQESTFNIDRPSPNEIVDIDSNNINNDDVWLYGLDPIGIEQTQWNKVSSTVGNNIIYNNLGKTSRQIFNVLTRSGDRIRLNFSDGVLGDLPQGGFKIYYRVSNGLSYKITPSSVKNVNIDVPYVSKNGRQETLTITLSLKYTVNNASSAESSDSVKQKAPSTYYTQGRMITGEDYNNLPLSTSQEIIKVKAVNRVSSGISRYFDLTDSTGKYSSTNLFGTDGILYKESFVEKMNLSFSTRTEAEGALINKIIPLLKKRSVYDFYLATYAALSFQPSFINFRQISKTTNLSTGVFFNRETGQSRPLGSFTSTTLKYLTPNSLVKFLPPPDSYFDRNNVIRAGTPARPDDKLYIWSKIINVVGNGTYRTDDVLPNGQGPVSTNEIIPTGAVLDSIIPKFSRDLDTSTRLRIVELMFASKEFALRFDIEISQWRIVSDANVDKLSNFNLGKTGDISNQQLDASWIVLFETDGEKYTVTNRATRYIFESEREVRFFFDPSSKIYNSKTGRVVRDEITVLGINPAPDVGAPLNKDYVWTVVDDFKGSDGYIDTKKISVSFSDKDEDSVIDDPELFTVITEPSVNSTEKLIFQQLQVGPDGITDYIYIENDNDLIRVFPTEEEIDKSTLADGQLVYIIDQRLTKIYRAFISSFQVTMDYRAFFGRSNIKFQYTHAADSSSRLDPSSTNIIDVYMLTRTYDTDYRRWIKQDVAVRPLPPSSDEFRVNFGSNLEKIKAVSDEVIYHPVKYKELFGTTADLSLQATIKLVKSNDTRLSDSDIKVAVINAINEFFSIENWEFGDTFHFAELSTYIVQKLSPNLANIVLVPIDQNLSFGSLYEIKSNSDEIFISSATVNSIEIISELTAPRLRTQSVVNPLINSNNGIQSRPNSSSSPVRSVPGVRTVSGSTGTGSTQGSISTPPPSGGTQGPIYTPPPSSSPPPSSGGGY